METTEKLGQSEAPPAASSGKHADLLLDVRPSFLGEKRRSNRAVLKSASRR